jgi:hypothetical protein
MKKLFIHNPIFRITAPPVYGVLVYLLILLVNNNLNELTGIFSNKELYVCIGLSYLSMESLRLSILCLNRLFKPLSFKQRTFVQSPFSLIISLLVVYAGVFAYFRWVEGFSVSLNELQIFFVIFGFTALLYNVLYFSNDYLFRENTQLVERENRLREKVEADFATFKNEINPDLLYESLEVILQTLYHDVHTSEEQIDLLAGVYRYQLMNRDKELVNVTEELAALNNLKALLNFRYSQQITLTSKLASLGEAYVIPGSLLAAMDTVVRNTLLSPLTPLTLTLYLEEDGYLVLQHKLNDKLIRHEESLQSFARIQRVYSFFSDVPFIQIKAYGENYIKFPIIKISEPINVSREA